MNALKLNLGCGQNPLPGYVNVDKFGSPDVTWDLEQFPWPWEESSVEEIVLTHVLEHLGESTATYFGLIKEMYRVAKPGAQIIITVPHPRHDDYLNDPTHVRPITVESLGLFSQRANREFAQRNMANSPLGLYLNVNLEVERAQVDLDPAWLERLQRKELTEPQVL